MKLSKLFFLLAGSFLLTVYLPAQEPVTYEKLLEGAETQTGGVYVHQKGGVYYLEIPNAVLDRDVIWYAEISRGPLVTGLLAAGSSPGQMISNRVIRLERHEKKLFLRDYTAFLDIRAEEAMGSSTDLMETLLMETNLPPILMAIPIEAENPEGSVVINASNIFGKTIPQFNPADKFPGLGPQDAGRSFVEEIKPFDNNLRVKSVLTYAVTPNSNPVMAMLGSINSQAATIEIDYSLYVLPDAQMMPRLADPRMGYFKTEFLQEGPNGGAVTRSYISRYRLEKQDPTAEMSEPLDPIVYYIGPNVPPRWRPAFKQAVEDWNVAFEAAGFRNAIVAKDPPDDPDWDPNDLGHSVIRWVAQPIANAQGPSVVDPRTGEILAAHVLIWENVLELASSWYYFEGSALDAHAQQLPLPEDVQERLMRYAVSHEVGHSIGLRHNHRAAQAYTIKQLRDPEFANANGPVASVMSYGRINYVAQPGDGVTELVPIIGPYDKLAIKYGYQPIPGSFNPDDEIPTLNSWLEVQRNNDVLMWGAEDEAAAHDPMVLTGNIGRDRVEATKLGLNNLQFAVANLPHAIGATPQHVGEIKRLFQKAVDFRTSWLEGTAKELYGVIENRTLDVSKPQYEVVSADRKKEVTRFLLEELKKPHNLFTPEIKRIYMPYELSRIMSSSQEVVLNSMLNDQVFGSLWDANVVGVQGYSVAHYLDDIQKSLFSELGSNVVEVDPIRRHLQAIFVNKLTSLIQPPPAAVSGTPDIMAMLRPGASMISKSPDNRGAARLILQELDSRLQLGQKNAKDIDTRAHLFDLQKVIEKVL